MSEVDEANAALARSEEKYRRIVETTCQGIWTIDAEGKTTFANSCMAEILGCDVQDLLGKTMFDFMDEEGIEQANANLKRREQGVEETHEFRFVRPDGVSVWTELATNPVLDSEGTFTGALAMVSDITQRRADLEAKAQLETRLHHSEKLEALGTLAGGIAHGLNNLLMPIMGWADLLRTKQQPETETHDGLTEIVSAAERAASLVQQILDFSHQGGLVREVIAIEPILRESIGLLRASLPAGIVIEEAFGKQLGAVRANPSKLQQVLLNLGSNAAHSMGGAGTITIAVDGCVRADMPHVNIRFSDTGTGIAPDILPRIFDPFFTTKEVGEGTGLGLAAAHSTITAMKGTLEVESIVDKGTVFSIVLPVAAEEEVEVDSVPESDPEWVGQDVIFRALVVDDEEPILNLLKQALPALGAKVEVYSNGSQAIQALKERPTDFDIAILDYNMPDLNGLDLATAMREIVATLPVLLCSGDIMAIVEEAKRMGITRRLAKPFRPTELVTMALQAIGDSHTAL